MPVKSIAECSKGEHSEILWTFIKLSFVEDLFCLFLSGCFTKVCSVKPVLSGHLKIDIPKMSVESMCKKHWLDA